MAKMAETTSLRSLRQWAVNDECLRVLDCGSLRCCFLADSRKICSHACDRRHIGESCTDDARCVDEDGLKCCNGKCIQSSQNCANLNQAVGSQCSPSTAYVQWNVCVAGLTCLDGKCSGTPEAAQPRDSTLVQSEPVPQPKTNITAEVAEDEGILLGLPLFAVIGIGAGILALLFLICGCCVYMRRQREIRKFPGEQRNNKDDNSDLQNESELESARQQNENDVSGYSGYSDSNNNTMNGLYIQKQLQEKYNDYQQNDMNSSKQAMQGRPMNNGPTTQGQSDDSG